MRTVFYISLGAVIGANLRYFVGQLTAKLPGDLSFPIGTLLINLTGSLILGFFLIWTTERIVADPRLRLVIAVGFCGGYTTYSSFAFETFLLFDQGRWLSAAAYVTATNLLCIAGAFAGAALARSI